MADPLWLGDPKPVVLFRWYAGLISSGALPPGSSLSIRRITAERGVGQKTAGAAIHMLRAAGLVEVRRGRTGTVVRGREGSWNEQVPRMTGR